MIMNRLLAFNKVQKKNKNKEEKRRGDVCFLSPCVLNVNLKDLFLVVPVVSADEDKYCI